MKVWKPAPLAEQWAFTPAAQDPTCSRAWGLEERRLRKDYADNCAECGKRRARPGYENIMSLAGRLDPLTGKIK
jgi:hypothetical protein